MLENPDDRYDAGEERPAPPPAPELGRSQKIAVAVLAVFAFSIIILWSVQFKKSLTEPFAYKGTENTAQNTGVCTGPDCAAKEAEALKTKDTDKDGLSDYDELNTYHTSPYIEDSDSDGISDADEVKNSSDPNCPQGKECYQIPAGSDSQLGSADQQSFGSAQSDTDLLYQQLSRLNNMTASSSAGQMTPLSGQSGATGTLSDQALFEKLLNGTVTAAELRQALINRGMDKASLDKINDEDLLNSFKEQMSTMLSQQGM